MRNRSQDLHVVSGDADRRRADALDGNIEQAWVVHVDENAAGSDDEWRGWRHEQRG